jgi:hypothetical protein
LEMFPARGEACQTVTSTTAETIVAPQSSRSDKGRRARNVPAAPDLYARIATTANRRYLAFGQQAHGAGETPSSEWICVSVNLSLGATI